jgi:ABC-type siderophore export system fused ATPase/permease subunit
MKKAKKTDDKGYVNKKMYMLEARNKLKLSRSQTYEVYNKYGKNHFEEIREGRSYYIRIKKKKGDEE